MRLVHHHDDVRPLVQLPAPASSTTRCLPQVPQSNEMSIGCSPSFGKAPSVRVPHGQGNGLGRRASSSLRTVGSAQGDKLRNGRGRTGRARFIEAHQHRQA
jgi:hypothetical protein